MAAKYCALCHISPEPGKLFKVCSLCRKVSYCSYSCQSTNWRTVHRKECLGVKKLELLRKINSVYIPKTEIKNIDTVATSSYSQTYMSRPVVNTYTRV